MLLLPQPDSGSQRDLVWTSRVCFVTASRAPAAVVAPAAADPAAAAPAAGETFLPYLPLIILNVGLADISHQPIKVRRLKANQIGVKA